MAASYHHKKHSNKPKPTVCMYGKMWEAKRRGRREEKIGFLINT